MLAAVFNMRAVLCMSQCPTSINVSLHQGKPGDIADAIISKMGLSGKRGAILATPTAVRSFLI
jgi:hypothetical protein